MASDPQVAAILSDMMGSAGIVVRRLSDLPESALANVFVFANGVTPDDDERGPFGFQADVFDSVPGDPAYSLLRTVNVVTWPHESEARVLGSVDQIEEAQALGEITMEQPGAVVNMPIVQWPGGQG